MKRLILALEITVLSRTEVVAKTEDEYDRSSVVVSVQCLMIDH